MLSSSADDDNDAGDEEEEESGEEALATPSRIKRKLPTRSKARKVSYTAEADSTGEDDRAKVSCSDDDETFSLQAMDQVKGKGKSKLKMGALETDKEAGKKVMDVETNEIAKMKDGDDQECEVETETESDGGESHATTFYSVADYVV